MDTFDKWFSRLMWATDIILLLASMPHIAAWFAHFDNPTDMLSSIYAWGVGFGLALAIDGVSLMLLLAITRMIRQGKAKSRGTMFGLLAFMAFIALLSWGINWQYNIQFASGAFAKADAVQIYGPLTVGGINPIIGGAFPILMLAYALVAKAMQVEVKPIAALSDEEQAARIKRAKQEQEYKAMLKGPGFVQRAKETAKAVVSAGQEVAETAGIRAHKDHDTEPLTTSQEDVSTDLEEDFDTGEREAIQHSLHEASTTSSTPLNNGLDGALKGSLETAFDELEKHYPRISAWRNIRGKSVTLKAISAVTGKHHKTVSSAVLKGSLTRLNAYHDRVLLTSVLTWLLHEVSEQAKMAHEETVEMPVVDVEKQSA